MCLPHYRRWYAAPQKDRIFKPGAKEEFIRQLTTNSSLHTGNVRIRCLHFGLLEPKCVGCGLEEWTSIFGTSSPLQLDHINGVGDDHRIENLRILCANCHTQTDTFAGRNQRRNQQKILQ